MEKGNMKLNKSMKQIKYCFTNLSNYNNIKRIWKQISPVQEQSQKRQEVQRYYALKVQVSAGRKMALPVPAHYKHAKQGGQLLLCPDGFELNKAKAEASRLHYVWRMKKKYGSINNFR